jgi:hypothetical protein
MVCRLRGDGSTYISMLQQASQATISTAATVQRVAAQVESFGSTLRGFAATAAYALGSFGITSYLRQAFSAFAGREETVMRLTASLEGHGRAVDATLREYERFAKATSESTTLGQLEVLQLLKRAEAFNLTGKAAENAVEKSIQLSAASGIASQMALRFVQMMETGDVKGAMRFARMIPELRGVKDETEVVTRYNALLVTGQRTLTREVETASGQLKQLHNRYIELIADFGTVVSEGIKPVVTWFKEAVIWVRSLNDQKKQLIVSLAAVAAAFLAVGPAMRATSILAMVTLNPIAFAIAAIGTALAVWVQAVGGVGPAWQEAGRMAVEFRDRAAGALQSAIAWVTAFADRNRKLVLALVLAAGAVAAVVVAFKLAALAASLLSTALSILHVQQLLSTAYWVASTAASVAWTAAVLVAKVATWLWNAALLVLNTLLAPVALLAAAAAVVAIGLAIVTVYAAAKGAYSAVSGLLDAVLRLGTPAGPVGAVSSMLKEWWSILQDVAAAAQEDLPLAWELLKAGFALAVAQVKQLWPPLWKFVQDGFIALWDLVSAKFELSFGQALIRGLRQMIDVLDVVGLHQLLVTDKQLDRIMNKTDRMVHDAEKSAAKLAQLRLQAAAAAFDVGPETEEVKAARAQLQKLRDDLAVIIGMGGQKGAEEVAKLPDVARQQYAKAEKEVHKFNSALVGTVEDIVALKEYQDKLASMFPDVAAAAVAAARGDVVTTTGSNAAPPLTVEAKIPAPAEAGVAKETEEGMQERLLREIRDLIARGGGLLPLDL